MKILITGGCGFVGSNLAIFLKKKGFNVFSLDNLFRKGSKFNLSRIKKLKIKNFKIDVSNHISVKKLPKFDLIIDCCAEASVESSHKEISRVFDTNLIGTKNLLIKCSSDKSNIIFISSSRVYSLKDLNNLTNREIKYPLKLKKEIDHNVNTLSPKTLYGFTKYASEELIKEFSYLYNFKYLINRCGVISGPWQFGKVDQGFFSLFIWRALNKKIIKLIGFGGNGHQVRDVLHIYDLCDLIYSQIRKMSKINNQLFTVGGGLKNSISLTQLVKMCEDKFNIKIKIKKIKQTSKYDIPYFVTSNKKVNKFYSWKPKRNLEIIFDDIYIWMNKYKIKLKKYL